MGSIHQHHAGNLSRIKFDVKPHVVSPHGVADKNIGRIHTCGTQQLLKLLRDHLARTRLGNRIAVAQSGAIVGTDMGELRDLGLHLAPRYVTVAQTRFQDNGWTSRSGAVYVHLPSTYVY